MKASVEATVETRSLALLLDLQAELQTALKSLGGKTRKGLFDGFVGFSSAHINKAAEGYIFLRQNHRIDASKLLIRSSIEAMIRIQAALAKGDVLFQFAFSERKEDRKLGRLPSISAGLDYDSEDEKTWSDFKEQYAAQFPDHELVEQELSLREAARIAGIEPFYDRAYRLYCKFTHAALSATAGDVNTDSVDNTTVAACVYAALRAVATIGADAPNLEALRERLFNFK